MIPTGCTHLEVDLAYILDGAGMVTIETFRVLTRYNGLKRSMARDREVKQTKLNSNFGCLAGNHNTDTWEVSGKR